MFAARRCHRRGPAGGWDSRHPPGSGRGALTRCRSCHTTSSLTYSVRCSPLFHPQGGGGGMCCWDQVTPDICDVRSDTAHCTVLPPAPRMSLFRGMTGTSARRTHRQASARHPCVVDAKTTWMSTKNTSTNTRIPSRWQMQERGREMCPMKARRGPAGQQGPLLACAKRSRILTRGMTVNVTMTTRTSGTWPPKHTPAAAGGRRTHAVLP